MTDTDIVDTTPSHINRYVCEFFGTLCLFLIGCGAVTVGTFGGAFPIGILPIALAFGLTIIGMAYAIGHVSGAHLNPAVTIALWTAGRIRTAYQRQGRDPIPWPAAWGRRCSSAAMRWRRFGSFWWCRQLLVRCPAGS